jgi:hypothetical protein
LPETGGQPCTQGCSVAKEVQPGVYEAELPTERWYSYRVSAPGFVTTLESRVLASAESDWFNAMRRDVLNGFFLLLGTKHDPARALLAGRVLDCQGRPVSGAELRVFSGQGDPIGAGSDATVLVYFDAAGVPSADRTATSSQARWAIGNAPVNGHLRLEMWGALSDGGSPELLACEQAEVYADTLTTGRLGPLRKDAPSVCAK